MAGNCKGEDNFFQTVKNFYFLFNQKFFMFKIYFFQMNNTLKWHLAIN